LLRELVDLSLIQRAVFVGIRAIKDPLHATWDLASGELAVTVDGYWERTPAATSFAALLGSNKIFSSARGMRQIPCRLIAA
jgi:hypothetical protein